MNMPKWATPERTERLRQLDDLLQSGKCTDGEVACPVIRRFTEELTKAVGKPDNSLVWLFRAAIVTPRILATLPREQLRHFPQIYMGGYDVVVEIMESIDEIVPCSKQMSPTGWTVAKKPIPTMCKIHLPGLVDDWKAADREMQAELWKRERIELHRLIQITHRGQFDSIARDEFFQKQPVFTIEAVGIGAFTLKPVAKVVVNSFHRHIWVDLTGIKKVSTNAKHKYFRYHRGKAPVELQEAIESRCRRAVKKFLG